MKFIAPKIDEIPAKCGLNIAKSTAPPECAVIPDNGGYTVQPVPAPTSIVLDNKSNINDGGNNQKLKLFKRGKAISGAPIIMEPFNYQIHQSCRHNHEKNHNKSMSCYYDIIKLISCIICGPG